MLLGGDRNHLRSAAVRAVVNTEAQVLLRLRWSHSPVLDSSGRDFHALDYARRLKIGQVGDWPASSLDAEGEPIPGRVVSTKLPAPVSAKAERRAAKASTNMNKKPDVRTL